MLVKYRNRGGDSGVESYEIGSNYMVVRFKNGRYRTYLYKASRIGSWRLRRMVDRAVWGVGLNSYINRHVYADYSNRI